MRNKLKHALAEGKTCVGTVVTIGSPVVAEIFAIAGYDWIWFDLEHTSVSLETLQTMIQAVGGYDTTVVVRVPGNDEVWTKRVLDLGPHAIIVPLVNNAEEAERAVRHCRYPPAGVRGAGIGRAQGFGESSTASYYATANQEIMIIPQIEHIEAVKNIEAILAVDGVEAIFLGTMDLSGSMGMLGHTDHPDVEAAQQKVKEACKRHGVHCGILAMSPEQCKQRIQEGHRFVAVGMDVDTIMHVATDWLQKIRQV
jgi:2-keto-3-deoxy-L-rhamnonate aldolase RhmA